MATDLYLTPVIETPALEPLPVPTEVPNAVVEGRADQCLVNAARTPTDFATSKGGGSTFREVRMSANIRVENDFCRCLFVRANQCTVTRDPELLLRLDKVQTLQPVQEVLRIQTRGVVVVVQQRQHVLPASNILRVIVPPGLRLQEEELIYPVPFPLT